MSLLEDVFLQDEANEAQELERVIEGGDYEERIASNSDDNSEKEDEAEEDKRRVDPASSKTKRVVTNPRFVLNPARLTGPRGIQVIPEHFKDFKFKGKGHEKEDLDLVLKKLEHWAYRLYPKFKFEDCLKKIEVLGKKRPVMVHLHKIRSDQIMSEEIVIQRDSSDDETSAQQEPDEFDKLLQQQIELARAMPGPVLANKSLDSSHIENRSFAMPKGTSSPSISDEQKERMQRNRRLAEERRLARLNNSTNSTTANISTSNTDVNTETTDLELKRSIACVVHGSDEENASATVTIDVHQCLNKNDMTNSDFELSKLQPNKRKANAEDSSDEENASETLTIDVQSHIQGNHRRSIDSNDNTNNLEIKESQPIKRKANITDSSDEENINETITVDVQSHIEERNVSISNKKDAYKETQNCEMLDIETRNCPGIVTDASSKPMEDKNSQARSSKDSIELNSIEHIGDSNLLQENMDEIREVILENSIIQSAIQGLVENDNNLNLERDLISQESTDRAAENAGSSNRSEQIEELMDIDFSEEF